MISVECEYVIDISTRREDATHVIGERDMLVIVAFELLTRRVEVPFIGVDDRHRRLKHPFERAQFALMLWIRFGEGDTEGHTAALQAVECGDMIRPQLEVMFHDRAQLCNAMCSEWLALFRSMAREQPASVRTAARFVDRGVGAVGATPRTWHAGPA